jgi:TRAP-type mannitol/chloroaromatic compound transport system substrate-binding protein
VLADFASEDELSQRIYDSHMAARARLAPWSDVAMRRFLEARDS